MSENTKGKATATHKEEARNAKSDAEAKKSNLRDGPEDRRQAARQTTPAGKGRSQ
jgi:hypothetical protein